MHLAIAGCSLMGGRWFPSGYYHLSEPRDMLHKVAFMVGKVFLALLYRIVRETDNNDKPYCIYYIAKGKSNIVKIPNLYL